MVLRRENSSTNGLTCCINCIGKAADPENYGVISIVMIFITFCDAIVSGGFGNAIVQKKDADELDVNTMLCCSVATSFLLYLIIFFAAPFIADFYEMVSFVHS